MQNKLFFLFFILILLNSCQAVQDGLAGKKNKNSDEFLIEKKNPLEIPPGFGSLPEPNKKIFHDVGEKVFSISKIWDHLLNKKELYGFESNEKFVHLTDLEILNRLTKNR